MVNRSPDAGRRRVPVAQPPESARGSEDARKRIAELQSELRACRRELAAKEKELHGLRGSGVPMLDPGRQDPSNRLGHPPEILRKIIDNIPVMIALYEPTAKAPFLNRHAARVLGIDEEAPGAIDIMALCYPDPERRREVWESMRKGPTGWKEVEMLVRGNKRITTSWANVRLSDGGYLGIGIDITERVRMQRAIRRGEEEIRQSRHLKMLGQLTTGMAHEVRNPLTCIMAMVEALRAEVGPRSQYDEYVQHMRTQVQRLERLMGNLLTLGRPIKKTTMQPMTVKALSDEAVDMWRNDDETEVPPLEEAIDPQVASRAVLVDGGTMQQAIVNLLRNAREYSPDGAVIQLRVESVENRRVRIRVIDAGPGMTAGNLHRAFEPFYTTRKAGTGLGLSIVQHVVVSHGGTVVLYNNKPDPGLTAEIRLPLVGRVH